MRMNAGKRALDKVYKRRDRYEIPDWQREKVWDQGMKQQLIDSILRGWKLPKFYFVKLSGDEYEVVDGQQRLQAIYEFFGNELPLTRKAAEELGAPSPYCYKDLPAKLSDAFDDFEIEYDEIEGATEEELKEFFQRLQNGLRLTSSEKLNAVHSKLTTFCRETAAHSFFQGKVAVPNTRYAHFDIVTKAVAVEIEGLSVGQRYDDLKAVFESQAAFSPKTAIAKRVVAALNFLDKAFPKQNELLKSRTVVQSLITLTCRLVATDHAEGLEGDLKRFFERFARELAKQVELGQAATDSDFLKFQKSVSANVRTGAQTRNEILLRKLFADAPKLAEVFDPSVLAESGVSQRVAELGAEIGNLVHEINKIYAAKHGKDLFKATNKTVQALNRIGKPIMRIEDYRQIVDDLYFQFRESAGQRLENSWPQSFADVNTLRTDLRHDVDHGSEAKVRAKRKDIGKVFVKYSGTGTPETTEPSRFVLVQANLLAAVEADLKILASKV